VIDESNCPVTDQVTINSSQAPGLDVYYTLAHCGMADGQLEVEGNMGMSPFMYSINTLKLNLNSFKRLCGPSKNCISRFVIIHFSNQT